MTQLYMKGHTSKAWRKLALVGLLGLTTGAAHAQDLNYNSFGAVNVAGEYKPLEATATPIATPNTDDANSAATPIGFSFSFNGMAFTNFVLNTNGYLALGTTAPAAPYFSTLDENGSPVDGPLDAAEQINLLMPFNVDLESSTAAAATYSYELSGTSPNRICTIQWKGVSDKTVGDELKQYASLDFQVKLYETSNRVEFVYNTATPSSNASTFRAAVVGLKGSSADASQVLLASKTSRDFWRNTSFISTSYAEAGANAHNYRKDPGPDAGRTYRFTSIQANDITVQQVYSLGKLPIPYGAPHVVKAYVANVGTADQANIKFTLTVSGANEFSRTITIGGITATGDESEVIISFPPFTPTNPGTNIITVTAAADDISTNNSASTTQLVNATTFAYAQPGVAATNSLGLRASGILGVKYTISAPRTVTGVTVRISDTKSVGNTVYGVVLDGEGNLIARSPDYTVLAADIDKDKTFVVKGAVYPGDFIVGLAQVIGTAPGYFPVGLQGSESPTREGAYFVITSLTGGTPGDAGSADFGAFMIEAVTDVPPTCLPPSGVIVASTTSTSAVLSFTGPANGTSYSVIYGPRGFDPASAGTTLTATGSPFTITGLMPLTNYDVYIRAICTAPDQSSLIGPIAFATPCTPPIIATFPYTENFDGVAAGTFPCGITVANINNDASTWSVVAGTAAQPAASAPNHMRYNYSTPNAANDWFFTPPLFLRAGTTYQLSFKYRAGSATLPEGLEVKYGNATTPAAQSNLLWSNTNIINRTYATTEAGNDNGQVKSITPATDGNYYIGFHAISAKDQLNLYVDDLLVTSTVVSGTSAALQKAITIYPNPTAGNLTIAVSGAKAQNGLQVEITNMLGQRVRTATVRDNFTNQLDISNLANGMYTVKVLNGGEYSISRISVQK